MSKPDPPQKGISGHTRTVRGRQQEVAGYTRTVNINPDAWRKSKLPPETRDRIIAMHEAGDSLPAIADALTRDRVSSPRGRTEWSASMVRSVLARAGRLGDHDGSRGGPKRLLSDEALARLVGLAREGHGSRRIAELMNEAGLTTPRGQAWSRSSVQHHLAGHLQESEEESGAGPG